MTYRQQPLIATSLVGVGAVITLALSVVTMKVLAVLVGPEGISRFALLQSLLNVGILLTSFGMQASAITVVAAARRRSGPEEATSVGWTAITISTVGSALGAAVLLLVREPLASAMLGDAVGSQDLIFLAPALLFSVVATASAGVLAGFHQLKAATAVNLAAAFLATAVMLSLVLTLGLDGFAPGLAAAAALHLVLAGYAVMRVAGRPRSSEAPFHRASRDLLGVGLPVALSQSVTNGALFLAPVLVLHTLGVNEVGLYRAAAAVSLGIASFFLAGIHQDFLPRMASEERREGRQALVERRMRLVVGIGLPLVLALLAVAPLVVDVLYSSEFRPAVAILEWQLVGDLMRLPATVLTVAVLAMRRRRAYVGLEAVGGVVLVLGTVLASSAIGLSGPGLGYAAAALSSLGAAWYVVHKNLDLRPGRLQLIVLGTAAVTASIVAADPGPWPKLILFGAAAVGAGLVMWPRLLRLHRENAL